nr:MAG TPA: hypothetical protein [Caudoviricetes sp.]
MVFRGDGLTCGGRLTSGGWTGGRRRPRVKTITEKEETS